MPQFTVRLTPLESKLLSHIAYDPTGWIENLVEWRVRIAQDEYLPTAIEQLKASGVTAIPGTRDEIILAANLPPKDPNWQPFLPDHPEYDEYTFDLEEDDLKMLAFMWENPHQHIHDFVVSRCQGAIEERAAIITKDLLADPNWTDPIPVDPAELIDLVHLVPAKEHMENTGKTTALLVSGTVDPTFIPVQADNALYKHREYEAFTGKGTDQGWSWATHQIETGPKP